MLNEFTFAARSTSVFSGFPSVVIRFILADELNPNVKFDPRFYLLDLQDSTERASAVCIQRAWVTVFGIFLFPVPNQTLRTVFISRNCPNFVSLKVVLKRLQSWESSEKPSLSTYFWRMNVLR
jgi:hypothetical protein